MFWRCSTALTGNMRGALEVPLPGEGRYRIENVYSDADADVVVAEDRLVCHISEDMRAVAVLLRKG